MSGFPTVAGANYLVDLFSASEWPVSDYYVALIVGAQPGVAIIGEELEEPEAADYTRARIENVSANWVTENGVVTNAIQVSFPVPSTEWGIVKHWALCDAAQGGRVLFAGDVEQFTVVIGEQVFFPIGVLSFGLELAGWKLEQ